MAPPGKHVMSVFVQYAPYNMNGGWDDAKREAFGDAVVDRSRASRRTSVRHPAPAGADAGGHRAHHGLTEGNIFQGELALHQLFFLRPAPAWASSARR